MAGDPPRRGPGRPRGAVTGATRDGVLDVASRLFAAAGFHGTSINDVAQQAGLSTAGLLHHFPSKRHLLAAVLAQRDSDDARALELTGGAGAGVQAGVWELLERMVDVARLNSTRHGMVKLYAMLSGEAVDPAHPAHDWLRGHLVGLVGDLAAAFEAGKVAGTVRPDAPSHSLARLVVAALDGLQVQWLAGGDAPAGRDAGPDMATDVRVFVDGLARLYRLAAASA